MIRFEYWDVDGKNFFVYTEDFQIAKEMRKEFKKHTTYIRNLYLFAWQFLIPKRIIPLLKRKFDLQEKNVTKKSERENIEKLDVEIKELTSAQKMKFQSNSNNLVELKDYMDISKI